MDEYKLIRKAVQGDSEAFEQLLVEHTDRLYRTAYLYVRNREDALDVVQETAYKAFSSIHQLRNEQYFLTWITKILINCAYDVQRKRRNEISSENEVAALARIKNEEKLDLAAAIGKLPAKHQTSIIFFYYYDMSLKEIATCLEVPENTIKTYLSRGKKQLRKLLGRSYFDGQRHIL
ncbi:sigma-70 family RNA polymerase sigma factor [Cytobacillus oceanisediminis]|uniref:RNA polymerase n=1 Tax=Cytobacillus oceanisediminis TaxID=665099 RepID=A0ABX3CJL2_9BACI|nr:MULTISPECIES: sigma-70 family RNA polymerase sigma factor [Cytobacillus]MBU8732881.1 sigma-70 family RNA polymerase sigma factor [Cytobacillus oceanisediminis]OHX40563.1 RNA polymerase [Cytobacillus oceanisediminis]